MRRKMINTRDRCGILDIGQTKFMVNSGRGHQPSAVETITNAVKDAELNAKDIVGIIKYFGDLRDGITHEGYAWYPS